MSMETMKNMIAITLQNTVAKLGPMPDSLGDKTKEALDGDCPIKIMALGCRLDDYVKAGKYPDEKLSKCTNCDCTELTDGTGGDLKCVDCHTHFLYEDGKYTVVEPQVLLRLKNTDRTDILFALRKWKKQLVPSSKNCIQELIDYIDNAGSK